MKVVINVCYGGFSLSAKAVKRMAELQGKPCFFFKLGFGDNREYMPLRLEDIKEREMMWTAMTVENPREVLTSKPWREMSTEECRAANKVHSEISLENHPDDRANPILIQVVEELGKAANGACAELKVIEIPDGMDYEIEEYDGNEHVAEKHRTWN